jgi:N-acetylglutamate synthase-like GNAT family acetyltransferase
MIIRPLTREDMLAFWQAGALERSVRGFVAEKDGQILGVTGLIYMPSVIIAFAEMRVDGQKYQMSIMRIAKRMQALMRESRAPIFAVADPDLPNSMAFLERVGFEQVVGRQYCFKNKES